MMAAAIGLLQLVLLAAGCFAVGIAALTALVYPGVRSHLLRLCPAQRTIVLRWACAAPLGSAVILTALCLLPSLAGIVAPQFDHCLAHHGHAHICFIHPPASPGGWVGWVVNATFWGLVVTSMIVLSSRAVTAARALRTLWLAARYEPAVGAHMIVSSLPFSAVVGLLRQKVILSTALAAALPQHLMRVVLAHEASHVQRHDSFWQLIASLLSVAHLPSLRRQLLADLALAAERACDEHAAEVLGDRLAVARAILFVERLFADRARVPGFAPGFAGSDVPARVEALLQPIRPGWAWMPAATFGVALLSALVSSVYASTLHHGTETLLGLLLH